MGCQVVVHCRQQIVLHLLIQLWDQLRKQCMDQLCSIASHSAAAHKARIKLNVENKDSLTRTSKGMGKEVGGTLVHVMCIPSMGHQPKVGLKPAYLKILSTQCCHPQRQQPSTACLSCCPPVFFMLSGLSLLHSCFSFLLKSSKLCSFLLDS